MGRFIRLLVVLTLIAAAPRSVPAAESTLSPAPDGSFSVVVIPDTQAYRGKGAKGKSKSEAPVTNPVFDHHTKWTVAHLETQRIAFVSHVGDIVDKNSPEQWAVAQETMGRLHGRVPYGISPGNHDLKASGDASLFQRHFPAARFAQFAWYGGTPAEPEPARYGDNVNSCQLFSAGGLEFVFLHLECNAPDAALRWADQMLQKHASRRAMITTHMGLGPLTRPQREDDFIAGPKGRMQWSKIHGAEGNTPQQMWEKCFRRHGNLFLIFCGDQSRTQALRLTSQNEAGRPVHEVLSDYMQTTGGGDCWLRVCRFLPAANRIDVFTVDSRDGRLCEGTKLVPERSAHQFSLPYAMSGPARR